MLGRPVTAGSGLGGVDRLLQGAGGLPVLERLTVDQHGGRRELGPVGPRLGGRRGAPRGEDPPGAFDGLLVLEFTKEFAQQSPEEFVKGTFVDGLQAKVVVVGVDTRFGYKNSGDVVTLRELGEAHGFEVIALEDVGDGERWSSTSVRHALAEGDVAAAARVLGRPHRVVGTVVHGHHRGRELGFPTANLSPDSAGLVPAEGVYAGWLTRLDLVPGEPDRTMPAAISIGTNPTFDTKDRRTVEAYVLDRDDLDLYDERVVVEFVEHIRPTLRFDSIDDLLVAMSKDVEQCRAVLTQIVHS